jgi:alpha-L-fucosidase
LYDHQTEIYTERTNAVRILISFMLVIAFACPGTLHAADETALRDRARTALDLLGDTEAVPFERTTHPDAQWFPQASFGLFVHWGIHSVAGIEPSWGMMTGCGWQKDFIDHLGWRKYQGRENYYTLLDRFDPEDYDPDAWIAAAAEAGMTYAVITTKHHGGYALWPSGYGELNTGVYLDGRDLIRPYVDACRKHGIKIGFYFSPRDWGYPGFPHNLANGVPYEFPQGWTEEQNRAAFEKFYGYTTGQISELLTRYGEIDLLWFDGMGWDGIDDIRTEQTLAWVRRLQPHIVINPRWGGTGDFETPEVNMPNEAPDEWWENCISWCGHWGYSPHAPFQSESWVISRLVRSRSWGGNLLLNVGPDGEGRMPPPYYTKLAHIGEWMDHCRESLIGADPVKNWHMISNTPLTRRPGVWYAHVLPENALTVTLTDVPEPASVRLMNRDVPITTGRWDPDSRTFTVSASMTVRDDMDTVIEIIWDREPQLP